MKLHQPKVNTFVIPLIRTDLIERCLETLYKHTPHNFYVYVIDQSIHGIDQWIIDKYIHLYIRPYRNLGFAKATNLGITLVETMYFTMCNDDVEFVHRDWWNQCLKTFEKVAESTPDRPAVIVNPASIRLADWSVGRASGDDFDIIPYKEDYTDEDWRHLVEDEHYVNEHLTLKPGSVIDGVTLYCSVIDTRKFLEIGMLDEHYYPGGGEDYDWCCLSSMWQKGYRSVGTTMSWVFHHWSATFKDIRDKEDIGLLVNPELSWNHNHEKWGDKFDIWGIKCTKCDERLKTTDHKIASCPKHPEVQYRMPDARIVPL